MFLKKIFRKDRKTMIKKEMENERDNEDKEIIGEIRETEVAKEDIEVIEEIEGIEVREGIENREVKEEDIEIEDREDKEGKEIKEVREKKDNQEVMDKEEVKGGKEEEEIEIEITIKTIDTMKEENAPGEIEIEKDRKRSMLINRQEKLQQIKKIIKKKFTNKRTVSIYLFRSLYSQRS